MRKGERTEDEKVGLKGEVGMRKWERAEGEKPEVGSRNAEGGIRKDRILLIPKSLNP